MGQSTVIDPTMDLIRSLDDPTKFVRRDRVAIFKPHRRRFPDETVIEVTADDLSEIAANVNRAYEQDGELVRLVIGHRKQSPDADETDQPTVVGYARWYKADLVDRPAGKVLRLTQTEYIRREYEAEARRHPGRSPEYDSAEKTITAVALLTRDPALTLGTVGYQSGNGRTYQMGVEMPNDADAKDDDRKDDDASLPDDEKQYASFCRYMKRYMEEASPTNVAVPQMGAAAAPPVLPEYHKLTEALLYANLDRQLDHLAYEGVQFDRKVERPKLAGMKDDAERAGHIQYMKAHYTKLPIAGGMIPLADKGATGAAPDRSAPLTEAEYRATKQYQAAHNLSFDAAMVHIKDQRK